jgi:hypothetical protein
MATRETGFQRATIPRIAREFCRAPMRFAGAARRRWVCGHFWFVLDVLAAAGYETVELRGTCQLSLSTVLPFCIALCQEISVATQNAPALAR